MRGVTARYSRVVDLLDVHREVADALDETCLALAGGSAVASEWLARVDTLLRWHIAGEDQLLIPEYVRLAPDVPTFGAPDIIVTEHRRIEGLLASGLVLPTLRRLHHVLEHHDEREARSLKPALDRVLPPERARRMLDDIAAARPRALLELPERVTTGRGDVEAALVADIAALCETTLAEIALPPSTDDERLRRLLIGQQGKLRTLAEDAKARIAAAQSRPFRERLSGYVGAYDRMTTMRGLLDNYREHAASGNSRR